MSTGLRNTPIQNRSQSRLNTIEDAARAALAELGRDRLTTAAIAERANCSIGTVYRYFPDRVAILDHIWPDRDDGVALTDAASLAVDKDAVVKGRVTALEPTSSDDGAIIVTLRVVPPQPLYSI
jgi:AcrR family transcriptional regulator